MSAPPEHWDPGLANERTRLAWLRTTLSIIGVGALAASQAGNAKLGVAFLFVVLLVAAVLVAHVDRRRHAAALAGSDGPAGGALVEIATMSALVVSVAAAGVAVAVT